MKKSEEVIFVYVTCASVAEAKKIATACVKSRTTACGNILPAMFSIYRWRGKMEETKEAVLILKTSSARYAALEKQVTRLHSYKVPCIAILDIDGVSAKYKAWLLGEVRRKSR